MKGWSDLGVDDLKALRLKFLYEYFLDPERLRKALRVQKKFMTRQELYVKYELYFGSNKAWPLVEKELDAIEKEDDETPGGDLDFLKSTKNMPKAS